MIKAAIAAAMLCATMSIGNAQARPNDEPKPVPCNLVTSWGCLFPKPQAPPVKQGAANTQHLTPSIPIPPPVRSR